MLTKHLTKAEFLTLIANYEVNPREWIFLGVRPAIVDFYAKWCAPCKMMLPILDKLLDMYKGRVDIYKVDTEKERDLAAAFGIRSIPSILFIPSNGKPQMVQGAMSKSDFIRMIEEELLVKECTLMM